ncbi:MAG: HIT family protein [Flavobacteriales bacterium]|nr:HIT family protein [Flavobacteriales bacterium]
MASIFTRIVNGDIPSYKVAEDDRHLAFLDIQPLARGHVLVIPKVETDYIFDIEPQAHEKFWAFAQKVAKAIDKAIPCERVGVAVIGLEVPHAHIHLVPINHVGDINFSAPKKEFAAEVMEQTAMEIAAAF